MEKLKSFEQFAKVKTENDKAQLQEEQNAKREVEANNFKSLLSEFNVTSIKELSEEQKSEFFSKLKGVEVNEAFLIVEGTRGQFGRIDKRGNIESVYTHYDSYPENMLPLIKKTYLKGGSPLNMVLKNGDNSGLEVDPSGMNYYGDTDNMKGNVKNIDRYISTAADQGGAEFIYLFDEKSKKWLMADIYAGDKDLKPAFESVELNESIKVTGKRDAKKVVTQYNQILFSKLNAIGASNDKKTLLGAIKKLFLDSMEDANFHREREKCAGAIKGNIGSIPVIVDGLGKMSVNIGSTRIKDALDKEYSRISNAASWSGIGIAEGTALFLEQCGFAKMGQDLLDRFNSFFEGEIKDNFEFRMFEAIKYAENVLEATVVMDAIDPKSKTLKKLLKKHNVKLKVLTMNGPGGGHPEVEMTGSREDLQAVLADPNGWDDPELGEYIEESVVNEAEVTSDEEFKEYAFSVLQKAFGDDFDEAKAQEVVDGLISKNSGDYGAMVGALKSSLG
ncbi:MAG: hypothetical protein HKN86_05490 [Acidimicrobiia bacterium]|nr:hypothetical protein [Acidimicrobiia bacterium]